MSAPTVRSFPTYPSAASGHAEFLGRLMAHRPDVFAKLAREALEDGSPNALQCIGNGFLMAIGQAQWLDETGLDAIRDAILQFRGARWLNKYGVQCTPPRDYVINVEEALATIEAHRKVYREIMKYE